MDIINTTQELRPFNCPEENCTACIDNKCIQCDSHYMLFNENLCLLRLDFANYCAKDCSICYDNGACIVCPESEIMFIGNYNCTIANITWDGIGNSNSLCPNNCEICQWNGKCLTCKDNYILNEDSECILPEQTKKSLRFSCEGNSSKSTTTTCGDVNHCKHCNRGVCIKCQDDYMLMPDSTCQPIFFSGDQCPYGCELCRNDTKTCLICKPGYDLLSDLTCWPDLREKDCYGKSSSCPEGCLACDSFDSCSICKAGYRLSSNFSCIKEKSTCTNDCLLCSIDEITCAICNQSQQEQLSAKSYCPNGQTLNHNEVFPLNQDLLINLQYGNKKEGPKATNEEIR